MAAQLVSLEVPSITVYYTNVLNLTCECRGIPKPDVQWIYNASQSVFAHTDIMDISNTGECNNTMHSASELTWAVGGSEDARKDVDGETVTCLCDNGVGSPVQTATMIYVQCK